MKSSHELSKKLRNTQDENANGHISVQYVCYNPPTRIKTRRRNWNTSQKKNKIKEDWVLFWQHALDTLDLAFDVRRDHTAFRHAIVQVEHAFSIGKRFPVQPPKEMNTLRSNFNILKQRGLTVVPLCAWCAAPNTNRLRVYSFHNFPVDRQAHR